MSYTKQELSEMLKVKEISSDALILKAIMDKSFQVLL